MNKSASRAMFLGDLFIITISALLLVFRSSYDPKLIFDVSIAVFPFLLIWIILAQLGDAYDLSLPLRDFMKRNMLLWFASISIAQIFRFVFKYLVSKSISTAIGLAIEAIGISIVFFLWKCVSMFLYKVSSNPEKQMAKRVIWSLVLVILFVGVASLFPFSYAVFKYSGNVYSVENSPSAEAALVLGAGVWFDGTPSAIMVERVQAASDLYKMGKIRFIVLSGGHHEVEAMLQLAETFGLDSNRLVLDISGESTLDSCMNMIHDHGFSNVAVISQRFHLFRALYLCDSMGIQSIGILSDLETPLPETLMRRYLREVFATTVGFIQIQALRLKQ
jgi:vancomycin permeability regulator SanA